jgi:hypothetical protein
MTTSEGLDIEAAERVANEDVGRFQVERAQKLQELIGNSIGENDRVRSARGAASDARTIIADDPHARGECGCHQRPTVRFGDIVSISPSALLADLAS